jgi:hypothetical protein
LRTTQPFLLSALSWCFEVIVFIVQDALHNVDTEVLFNDILEQRVFPANGASADKLEMNDPKDGVPVYY